MARISSMGLINELEHFLHGCREGGLAADILVLYPYSKMWAAGVDSSGQMWTDRGIATAKVGP